jgi:uncharacterized membrane protein
MTRRPSIAELEASARYHRRMARLWGAVTTVAAIVFVVSIFVMIDDSATIDIPIRISQ